MRNPLIPLGPDVTEQLRAVLTKLSRITEPEKLRIEEACDVGDKI